MNTKKHYDKNDFIMTLLKGRTFIVLIILVILFSILSENFFSTSTLLMVAKHVALYGILAIGMTYVIITGGIDLSVGSVVGLGGMIGGYLIQKGLTVGGYTLYFSVPMVILIVILLGCAIGWVNGAVITKLRVAPFIATLGTMYICRGFANIISTGRTFSSLAGMRASATPASSSWAPPSWAYPWARYCSSSSRSSRPPSSAAPPWPAA